MALASSRRSVGEEHEGPASGARPGIGARQGRYERAAVVGVLVLGIGGLFALWISKSMEETRAVRHLPQQERRALYERTLHTLQGPCRPADDSRGLRTFCTEQATFIQKFPECDAACRGLAMEYLRNPAR